MLRATCAPRPNTTIPGSPIKSDSRKVKRSFRAISLRVGCRYRKRTVDRCVGTIFRKPASVQAA